MASRINVIKDKELILNNLETKSSTLFEYVTNNTKSTFILYYKYLTHSDLPAFGKATSINSLGDNLLYYLSEEEMRHAEEVSQKNFETAHQSNIGLGTSFWNDLSMPNPRKSVHQSLDIKNINNYASVYLVNDSLKYFNSFYTKKVFNKLDKNIKSEKEWLDENINLKLSDGKFTEISLTQAVHGIGVTSDVDFRKLRHHMFKNDIIYLLIEENPNGKNLFIAPVKNPIFYTIAEETNKEWETFQQRELSKASREARIVQEKILEVIDRTHQDKWRNLLAEEMMNYTPNDNEVFCPLTYITADFNNIGTIYRASHIKAFAESEPEEKYDINNGLLLVANADALFDKHLITIDEERNLVFSFLLEHDYKLKAQLLLNQPIFKDVLNNKRMMYISTHRSIFQQKEIERKKKVK